MECPFPLTPEDITPPWLTAALSTSVPGSHVAAIEVLEQHSGTTGRLRLGLRYGAGSAGPASVFVKLPPFDEAQRRLVAATDMGRREARFYAGPAREVPMRLPQAYYAASGDDPTQYAMVLEDLGARGCTFLTRLQRQDAEHAARLVADLATLHGHFWEDLRLTEEWSWLQPAMRGGGFGARLIEEARKQFATEMPPVFDELCRFYIEHHRRIVELWDEGEGTLIHGDTHAGNQFRDGAAVGLYDWAVISRSPGIRDVAIYLGNSYPTEPRRRNEDGLLRAYREGLIAAGGRPPALEVLWERYRACVLYAWVAATTTAAMGSKWQPREVGILGMARATDACSDLETMAGLRARL